MAFANSVLVLLSAASLHGSFALALHSMVGLHIYASRGDDFGFLKS